MKPILLALVGPTGVGKTQVSLDVASALNAEILSMDSMQIYRGMDIGTAKSSFEERRGIAHHMIDVADPSERFTVADYRDQAIPIIDDILSRGKQPMLVGGTGLYLDAIRYDMNLGRRGADEAIRLRLRKIAEEPDGQLRLHEMLRAVDPQTAEKLQKLLAGVVAEGTGQQAAPSEGTAAGKTGTAQTGQFRDGEELKNYWFAGFYPAEKPRWTLVVMQDAQTEPEVSSAAVFARLCDALGAGE